MTGILLQMAAYRLAASAPENDRFANRIVLTGASLTVTGSTVGANKESGEPDHAGNSGGQSVWWSWDAPDDGEVQITTDGSSFDTLLGVYTGSRVSALVAVANNDDHGSLATSRVRFGVRRGIQYQIAVDGYNDGTTTDSGSVRIALTFQSEPILRPTNDNFSNRLALTGAVTSVIGSNFQATRDAGEPYHAHRLGDTSIWFTWTAPVSGAVKVNTEGSSFDTVLALYSGSTLTSLTEVASNDDIDTAAGINTSAVAADVLAGQTFQIAVDGSDGASGTVALHIETLPTLLSALHRLPDGRFQFAISGASNRTYAVEASGNLNLWTEIGDVFNTNGWVGFTDPVARNLKLRFYRARLR
jgi:hypothetical protein